MKFKIEKKSGIPLYIQLAETIKTSILNGDLLPNQPFPFMEDLSRELDISMITVRKALNLLEQENLIYKIKGTGSFVKGSININNKSKLPPSPELKPIYILTEKQFLGGYFSKVYESAVSAARRYNIDIFVEVRESYDDYRFLDNINKINIGGIYAMGIEDDNYIRGLIETGIPVIAGDNVLSLPLCDYIVFDVYKGARCLMQHLLDKGHRDILYVEGLVKNSQGEKIPERSNGIRMLAINQVIKESKLNINLRIFSAPIGFHSCYNLGKKIYEERNLPTAVFAFDDTVAEPVILALKDNDIKIPQDMSVVGLGGYLNKELDLKITSYSFDLFKMGQMMVERLLQRMKGYAKPGITIEIGGSFVQGETAGKICKNNEIEAVKI
ncbi:MAG: hypothetical protein A2452_09190 [Candidatus Firestonebacteria bacterium RIFOXYC2_FULL_39_67]|nr:MAG: hypothetical protein A2536_01685 [Candidatus Firestonebacteria bacterium RIFOXYD2_FULL_39_29]OGF56884.1 MAG: hypothetical protein A2452_09190 [Candidatus Firestonebacteria bacterium RIFOXYC2_FULL_39_67]OGF57767.1 MAG: hypothetical protein A2497_02915 [Candidatus Firestonebacteria bacterium RifOxyC12_full_39_7]